MPTPGSYFIGLDLGQAHDYTALTVLEKSKLPDPDRPERMAQYMPGNGYDSGAYLAQGDYHDPSQRDT